MLPELSEDTVNILKWHAKVGVAVSGGGDSIALLLAVHAASVGQETQIFAASVDHGLRVDAAQECEFVAELCRDHDISHTTLKWDGAKAIGNLQAAARDARYRLLADWARANDIQHVLLGHTLDDQAETILMAIGRGAGPDGLSGMSFATEKHGVTFMRPLLHVRRDTLRNGLIEAGQRWIDDPSNDDQRFQRVRVRGTLAMLEDAGVRLEAFSKVGNNMANTAELLQARVDAMAADHVIADQGDFLLRQDIVKRVGAEAARRIVLKIIAAINSRSAKPRRAEQIEALRRIKQGEDATLAGCRLSYGWGMVRFSRELRAVQAKKMPTDHVWDGRWQLDGPHTSELHVAPLADGLNACPDWRQSRLPASSLRAGPAVWRDETLIAAPLARLYNGWSVQIVADLPTSGSGH